MSTKLDGRYVHLSSITIFLMNLTIGDYRCSDEEVAITRMLDKVLRRSDAIDKESLCILVGHRVRRMEQLYPAIHCWIGLALATYAPLFG